MTHPILEDLLKQRVAATKGVFADTQVLSDINGEIYSNDIFAFTKEGKLQVLKSQLNLAYRSKTEQFPLAEEKTFEQFLEGIRDLCTNNPYYMNLISETESIMTFELGANTVAVNLEVIQEPEVQQAFKEYLDYYNNNTGELRHWDSQTVYYNRDTKKIVIVDFATVWYRDIRPDRDVAFFGCHDDNNLYVFSFTKTFNDDQTAVINRLRQMAVDRSLEFKLTYIE